VYAAADGVVVAATRSSEGYGDHVIIAHDDHTFTLYGHLESFAVHPGDRVKQGQLIGLVGSTGNSTGPHTHFEVRVDRKPTDPAPYLPPLPDGAKGPPAQ
jgi:murein DD-endopeptidase MepM/ murein hydrolase activator NlpD